MTMFESIGDRQTPSRDLVDRALRGLGVARARNDFELCRWLRLGRDVEVHKT
jgi:hypothetical protein